MSGLRRLALVAVAAAGVAIIFFVGRHYRPSARMAPPQGEMALYGALDDTIGTAEPIDDVRRAELSRRAQRPDGDPKRESGASYDGVLNGWHAGVKGVRPKPAEPMPPTSCRSIEPVPDDADSRRGPHRTHDLTVKDFESTSGFGFFRMFSFTNDRGVVVASRRVDRVELVSLLTGYQPSVYVLDQMATPPLARQAKRRPLDEFERLGLDAMRRGEELVWTRDAPTRMFGAIRARADCLHCHAHAREGDLLGAFTYYLNTSVDRLHGDDRTVNEVAP